MFLLFLAGLWALLYMYSRVFRGCFFFNELFLNVGSVWNGCYSVLEKMLGRRGSSMRYSYVCVVLVHLFKVTNLELFSVHCF